MKCAKNLLFFFNLLFVISGIALITVGSVNLATEYNYAEYNDTAIISIIFIVVGAIVVIVAFFGCCGACKENYCMVITFSVLLMIILILEVAASMALYIPKNKALEILGTRFNTASQNYFTDKQFQTTFDTLQMDIQCCGTHGKNDWYPTFKNDSLPYTCCEKAVDDGSCNRHSADVYNDGCVDKLKEIFKKGANIIGAVGLAISIIQVFGIMLACSLARSIRKEKSSYKPFK